MAETLAPRFNGAVHISGTAQSSVGRCSPKSTTLVPERALLAHKTGSSLLTSSSPYTKSPLRPSPTVTPVSPVASSPSPVSPAVSARIGQFNSSGMSTPQPKSGSVVSTPSSRPGVFSPTSPKSPFNPSSVGFSPSPGVQHSSSSRMTTFSEDDADREIESLNCGNEATVMDFYNKCIRYGHTGSAIIVLEMAMEYVLEHGNRPGLFKEALADATTKRDRMKVYSTLSKTSTNPSLVARYGSQLANDYLQRSRTNAAESKREAAVNCAANAEILYDMVLSLTTKPGLGSFKREYEAKLVEAQREKARLSATSSPMPKPSAPPSTFSSSSGQPPLRTEPTPPMPGGMVSTPPKAVPGRFPVSAPGSLSTSVPSSRPAPMPPPQGSFSAPPSDISVRPSFCQSSSSSSTPTPTSLAVTPLTSPTPRLLTLHEFVSDLQRRPGLPGIDFLTAEDIKNSRHLVLEIVRPGHYNMAKVTMQEIIDNFEWDQLRLNNDFFTKEDFIRTQNIRGSDYYAIAQVLAKYQTNADHAWLTLFYFAAACNSKGKQSPCPKKQVDWDADHFVFNRFAMQRKLGIDNQLWTQAYCQQISPFVDAKWKIGDTYEEADRKGNLYKSNTTPGGSDEAAFRQASGLHHYRMMGTNSIQYGGYSNM